ncbi:MAG: RluA family pseudouridine synthase [Verrucomicrobiales bacterium]|nr:RluA family pseudouridine synthase [Verrucomicrobiales bacterium]
MRTDSLTVETSLPRARLDTFLHQQFPCVSRGTLQRLIREGEILVNEQAVKPTHHPAAGEQVTIHWPDPKPPTVEPRALPLEVLHEDDDLLVLNKAAGMVVHPAAGNEDNTLVNALLHHCRGSLSGIGGVERPGIVHRLDQFTSGVMVVAKNDATHMALSHQFAHRQVQKLYDAIACGAVMPARGEIDAAIMRHPNHRKVMTVATGGRSARTSYRVVERLRGATLVEVQLHTGRTHQVRVHFKHLGFPLVGDDVYAKRQIVRLKELTGWAAARQMLHARRLSFVHPASGEGMEFEAPWPEDFRATVLALREPPVGGAMGRKEGA